MSGAVYTVELAEAFEPRFMSEEIDRIYIKGGYEIIDNNKFTRVID